MNKSKEKRNITNILTVSGYGDEWYFKCIDFALKYLARQGGIRDKSEIRIVALKTKQFRFVDFYLAKIIEKVLLFFNRGALGTPSVPDETVLIEKKNGLPYSFDFKTKTLGLVKIRIETVPLTTRWSSLFKIYFHGLGEFIRWRVNFGPRFLHDRFRGIVVGDIAGSETIRNFQSAGGRLVWSTGLLHNYLRSRILTYLFQDFIRRQSICADRQIQIITPDLSYFPELLSRVGHAFGLDVVRTDSDYYDYEISGAQGVSTFEFDLPVAFNHELLNSYFRRRIKNPASVLPYINASASEDSGQLLDVFGDEVELQPGITAVVFPHVVSDAAYWRGLDGYRDIVEWFYQTIESLLRNPNIGNILIKLHPAKHIYLGDTLFEATIRKQYRSHEKVTLLSKKVNISVFKGINRIFCITHHGSISEELTFLRIPNVKWFKAPGAEYEFSQFQWSNPTEYESILETLKEVPKVTKLDIERLFEFVFHYRVAKIPYTARQPRNKYAFFLETRRDVDNTGCTKATETNSIIFSKANFNSIVEYHTWLVDEAGSKIYYNEFLKKQWTS